MNEPGTTDLSTVINPKDYRELDDRFRSICAEHQRVSDSAKARRQYPYDKDVKRLMEDEGYGAGC
jgi:hypothetical protein